MNPIAALMLSRSIEEERRRVLAHRHRWLSQEQGTPEHRSGRRSRFQLPRFSPLVDSEA
jgi:hypothetical protein